MKATKTSQRLAYLDWVRGIGVLIMLQGHVFDAWVRPQDRSSEWFWLSQALGGYPAPIFLFLVGVSLALVLDRMRSKGASPKELTTRVLRRGGWILILAYAFRLEQFLVWYPHSRWGDVFRVDTLNCIAVCTVAIGLLSILFNSRHVNIAAMGGITGIFVFATPLLYPVKGLPPFVLSYLNGNGNGAFFSFFPWAAFTLAGITFGYVLLEGKDRLGEPEFFKRVAIAGILTYVAGSAMRLTSIFEYGFFDYSLTSPHFFLIRLGCILLILSVAYLWCSRGPSSQWSPIIIFGQGSLIVYWLHMEVVYGRPFKILGRSLDIRDAALQLVWFVPLMLVLAYGLSRRGRTTIISIALRRPQDRSQVACT